MTMTGRRESKTVKRFWSSSPDIHPKCRSVIRQAASSTYLDCKNSSAEANPSVA
jgi:hypothetical protein